MEDLKLKRNKKKFFPLGVEQLEQLTETDSGIVLRKDCRCRLKMNYTVLPVGSEHFKTAVSEELNSRVLKYNQELNDMVLKYTKIRVLTPIEANRCRKLTVTCISDVFVFKPQCDSILNAVVNKKSKSHIGGLIYNVFNVSIIKPPELPFHQWLGCCVEVKDVISFKILEVDVSEVIPYIIGELISEKNNESTALETDKDSAINSDLNSIATCEGRYSDLASILKTIDSKSKKRKKLPSLTPTAKKPKLR